MATIASNDIGNISYYLHPPFRDDIMTFVIVTFSSRSTIHQEGVLDDVWVQLP